jgi:hypothetical protein
MTFARVFVLVFELLLVAGIVSSSAQVPVGPAVPLGPFVTLQKFRLYLTTKGLVGGQPFRADLYYWVGPNMLHSNPFQPLRPPQSGETQIVDHTFGQTPQDPAPTFPDLAHARAQVMFLLVKSSNAWTINHYVLIGKFMQTNYVWPLTGGKLTPVQTDLGWRLMAVRDEDLVIAPPCPTQVPDVCNFYIPMNGTF